jgi:cytochrome b pre-mRNA-processing protein 3
MFTCQLNALTVGNTMPLLTSSVNGFWKKVRTPAGETLCLSALNQARSPHFYETWDVPDTLEGRFDCAVLHMCLLLRHLKGPTAQSAFDAFFSYTELTLRELGVSDLKVGKQVKNCAKFFYGALKAYEDGLEGRANLEEAIIRNLYGNSHSLWAHEMEEYARRCDEFLRSQTLQGEKESLAWPGVKSS